MSQETRLVKNTAIIAIGNICTKIISFFMVPLYTNLLSTEEYGTADLISVMVTLAVAIMTFQLEQGIFRYLIEARGDKEKQKEYISTVLIFTFLINIVILFSIGLVLVLIKYEYTFYVISMLFASLWLSFFLQIPRGLGNNIVYSTGAFINASLNVILNVLFIAILKWKVEGILSATFISQIVGLIYLILATKIWKYFSIKSYNKNSLKTILKFSYPMIFNQISWWVVSVSDRLIIKFILGIGANGIYTVANKFPSILLMFTTIFQMAWGESAAENVDDKDSTQYVQNIMTRSVKFYSSANVGIICVLPFVFNILIGKDYADSYNYIPILLTGALFNGLSNLYSSLFMAKKNTKTIARTTIISALINVVINLVFMSSIKIYAAAISTLVAYFVITVIRHFEMKKVYDIKYSKVYLLCELLIYAISFTSYYLRITWVQVIVLIVVAIYCIMQNYDTIKAIFKMLLDKVKSKKKSA